MKRYCILILFSCVFYLIACHQSTVSGVPEAASQYLADSITLEGKLGLEDELDNMTQVANGDFIGVSTDDGLLRFNSRGKLLCTYSFPFKDPFLRIARVNDDGSIIMSGDGQIVYICDTAMKSCKKYCLPPNLPFCTSDYFLGGNNCQPVRNDTLFAQITIPTPWGERVSEKADIPLMSRFKLRLNDTAQLIDGTIPRPASLVHTLRQTSTITKGDSIIYLMPGRDSMLIYSMKTNYSSWIAIHNADYVLPIEYKPKGAGDAYNDYMQRYLINYFAYIGLTYVPQTKHYLLAYQQPLDTIAAPDRQPAYQDKDLRILILDEHFQQLRTVLMPKGLYISSGFASKAGVVFPVYNEQLRNESGKIKCYIYKL